jgi:trans-aconitate 2-methyltransferase
MPWDPDKYHQFQKERFAPFEDLSAMLHVRPGMEVIDLGCGTGELTARLADLLPESQVLGIDNSLEMLERARKVEMPGLTFRQEAIEEVQGAWDLVFSHAVIQWLPDHASLVPRLFSLVRPGGQLAVQMPSNHDHPTHRLILETAAEEPFRTALGGWARRSPVLSIAGYAELLYRAGAQDINVIEKVYPHILESPQALADWTSGTALVPYFERLNGEMRERFMERYRSRLEEIWPTGPVFYGFRRILFSAHKAGTTLNRWRAQ